MKYVDEFRDPAAAKKLLRAIEANAAKLEAPIALMEVCGGHTHTIYRYGLENLLPENIELVHGPGCPVCVIPMGRVDDALWLAAQDDVILATFGDMMRVPGSDGSLLDARARGADVRFVYSPLDALKLAQENPDKHVVFFAVGFETTAPSTAVTLEAARRKAVPNFSVFSNHVTIEPPLRAIVDGGETEVDGFIGPGHVATVVGTKAFDFLPDEFGMPCVVAGFEPLDILQAAAMLLEQFVSGDVAAGKATVGNQYARVVRAEGNPAAEALLDRVFTVRDRFEWRGLGWLDDSGLGIADEYAQWDAEKRFTVPGALIPDPVACECGSVLTGRIKPWECRVFGTACTPDTPIGTCMVSPEGACAAYYNFGRIDRKVTVELGSRPN
ncbi:hydrogenase formation protein HypD [Corynebacterium freneyi]|uniref:Hydrogenase expression/formation protein HypD n=1 Tax=Corynebacterium freneyi TaxID=134034 RepID=A0ABS4U642_9CORY|nr:hydrogenase formation protein HypD [Corynebacterium freneyi]MBP2331673.1 hydrogenase expression/formation protein HypD [Corynebacterium freneyi]QXA51874.1 hydrogenase formation protein HypD [Corynebacterium freneyi]WJZ06204.1 Hydrogenase expression/formation protein HypD [Corynebacterium freneyi]